MVKFEQVNVRRIDENTYRMLVQTVEKTDLLTQLQNNNLVLSFEGSNVEYSTPESISIVATNITLSVEEATSKKTTSSKKEDKASAKRIEDLEAEVASLTAKVTSANEENVKLEAGNATLAQTLVENNAQLAKLESEVMSLNTMVEQLTNPDNDDTADDAKSGGVDSTESEKSEADSSTDGGSSSGSSDNT